MNRTQFVEMNEKGSNVLLINYGVPQEPVLAPHLFLIYINDLHGAVTLSKIHNFVYHLNMIYIGNSLRDINRKVKYDLRDVVEWLRAEQNFIKFRQDRTYSF